MRSVFPMKAAKISYIVVSVLYGVFGAVLLCQPGFSVALLGRLLGIGLLVFGLIKLLGYFSRDLFRLAFQYDLAFGILMMALGVIVLSAPEQAMEALCVAVGIVVLADGLFKIQIAVDAHRFGIGDWWLIALLALVTGVAGLLLILHPGGGARALTVLMGLSLLAEGVLNLCVAICTVKIVSNQQPDSDVIELDSSQWKDGKDE